MAEFIKVSEVEQLLKKQKIDENKITIVIETFNDKIKESTKSRDFYCLNTHVDSVPYLNDTELEKAREKALEGGWDLTMSDDNYQSKQYKLQKCN